MRVFEHGRRAWRIWGKPHGSPRRSYVQAGTGAYGRSAQEALCHPRGLASLKRWKARFTNIVEGHSMEGSSAATNHTYLIPAFFVTGIWGLVENSKRSHL